METTIYAVLGVFLGATAIFLLIYRLLLVLMLGYGGSLGAGWLPL